MKAWYSILFHINDQINSEHSVSYAHEYKRHIDLALIDLVISNFIESLEENDALWRIHTRWKPGEQFLKLIIYCEADLVEDIVNQLSKDDVIKKLRKSRLLLDLPSFERPSPDKQKMMSNLGGMSDTKWPNEIKFCWPHFIQGVSKSLICLLRYYSGMKESEIRAKSTDEIVKIYIDLQQQIDDVLYRWFSHAFLHHIHAVFGYPKFHGNLKDSSNNTGTFDLTGIN